MAQTIINSIMPNFKLQAYRKGEGFVTVSNDDLKGKWAVLLFRIYRYSFCTQSVGRCFRKNQQHPIHYVGRPHG